MKIIYNSIIPFPGFKCINLYGTLFARKGSGEISKVTENHEAIHTAQMKDFCKWLPLGGTIFYIVYFMEWLYQLILPPYDEAYNDISFEKEAYLHQSEPSYLKTRKPFAQWKEN